MKKLLEIGVLFCVMIAAAGGARAEDDPKIGGKPLSRLT